MDINIVLHPSVARRFIPGGSDRDRWSRPQGVATFLSPGSSIPATTCGSVLIWTGTLIKKH